MKQRNFSKYIISSAVAAILLSGCFGGTEEEKKTTTQTQTNATSQTVQDTPAVTKVIEETKEAVQDVAKKANDVVEESIATTKEVAKEVVQEVQTKIDEVVATTSTQTTNTDIDVQKLYAKCIACHGTNGEKVALGKSKIIKDMSKEDFINAMIGYQKGTYGGSMKGIMASQVKGYTKEDIEAIANHIVK